MKKSSQEPKAIAQDRRLKSIHRAARSAIFLALESSAALSVENSGLRRMRTSKDSSELSGETIVEGETEFAEPLTEWTGARKRYPWRGRGSIKRGFSASSLMACRSY